LVRQDLRGNVKSFIRFEFPPKRFFVDLRSLARRPGVAPFLPMRGSQATLEMEQTPIEGKECARECVESPRVHV